jgi:hypothetical protein
MEVTPLEDLLFLLDILREYRCIDDSIDRFNRAIDIVEYTMASRKIRKHLSSRVVNEMQRIVMACSPTTCPAHIFDSIRESISLQVAEISNNNTRNVEPRLIVNST